KTLRSRYTVNLMHLQNAESSAARFREQNLISSNNEFKEDILTYSERSISNMLISGEHRHRDEDWTVDGKVSPTYSRSQDKDFRRTPYLIQVNNGDTSYSVNPNEVAYPSRFWR